MDCEKSPVRSSSVGMVCVLVVPLRRAVQRVIDGEAALPAGEQFGDLQRTAQHDAAAPFGVRRLGGLLTVDRIALRIQRGVIQGEGGVAVVLHAAVAPPVAESHDAGASHGAAASRAGTAAASTASAAAGPAAASAEAAATAEATAAGPAAASAARTAGSTAAASAASAHLGSAGAIGHAVSAVHAHAVHAAGTADVRRTAEAHAHAVASAGPPNQSLAPGISRPRLTLPLTSSEGSAEELRSAISAGATFASGAAAPSPEEFTSTRWNVPASEGRPPLRSLAASILAPRPVGLLSAACITRLLSARVRSRRRCGRGRRTLRSRRRRRGRCRPRRGRGRCRFRRRCGRRRSHRRRVRSGAPGGRNFRLHSAAGALNAIPTSLDSLAKPNMSTSIFHVPSASSANE